MRTFFLNKSPCPIDDTFILPPPQLILLNMNKRFVFLYFLTVKVKNNEIGKKF